MAFVEILIDGVVTSRHEQPDFGTDDTEAADLADSLQGKNLKMHIPVKVKNSRDRRKSNAN